MSKKEQLESLPLWDTVYKLPKEIECFIERFNNETPNSIYAMPRTLNREVTIFKNMRPYIIACYDAIESDIVTMLDIIKFEVGM